jgi:HSP20 family molecular chaperone IbpA
MSLLLAFPDESHFRSRFHSRFGGPRMCGGASRCGPGAYSCSGGSPRTQANNPPVSVVEDETGLLLIADLPGMSKNDVR